MMSIPSMSPADRFDRQPRRSSFTGAIAGALGIGFGLFGIFTIGLIFVPLSVLCSGIGILRGLIARSVIGIGLSLVGGALAFAGFMVSPSLWLLAGAGIVASQLPLATVSHNPAHLTNPAQASIRPQVDPRLLLFSRVTAMVQQMQQEQPRLINAVPEIRGVKNQFRDTLAEIVKLESENDGRAFSMERSRLAVAVNQKFLHSNMGHLRISASMQEWRVNIEPFIRLLLQQVQACNDDRWNSGRVDDIGVACDHFDDAVKSFMEAAKITKSELDDTELIFQQEQQADRNLLRNRVVYR